MGVKLRPSTGRSTWIAALGVELGLPTAGCHWGKLPGPYTPPQGSYSAETMGPLLGDELGELLGPELGAALGEALRIASVQHVESWGTRDIAGAALGPST
jgi:hypothetical protein